MRHLVFVVLSGCGPGFVAFVDAIDARVSRPRVVLEERGARVHVSRDPAPRNARACHRVTVRDAWDEESATNTVRNRAADEGANYVQLLDIARPPDAFIVRSQPSCDDFQKGYAVTADLCFVPRFAIVQLKSGDVLEEDSDGFVSAVRHDTQPTTWTRFEPRTATSPSNGFVVRGSLAE